MRETNSDPDCLMRVCPVCEGREHKEWAIKATLRLVRCARCQMIFANPVRSDFASGEYYDREAASYYLSPDKLQSDYANVRFNREIRMFRAHCTGGEVLDVGCSSGAFLFQLQKRFPGEYRVRGIDASGPALDYAEQKGIPVTRGEFVGQQFPMSFDAVTFWAVLEHVLDPAAFLAKAAAVLRKEGFCFVLVPNLRSLAARLLGVNYRYIYLQHLNYFTSRTLGRLASPHFD